MICPNCHTDNKDSAVFCKKCFMPLKKDIQITPKKEVKVDNDSVNTNQTNIPSGNQVSNNESEESINSEVELDEGNQPDSSDESSPSSSDDKDNSVIRIPNNTVNPTLNSMSKNKNTIIFILIAAIALIVLIYTQMNGSGDNNSTVNNSNNSSNPVNNNQNYSSDINLFNTIENRSKYEIDYSELPNNNVARIFEEYHIVEEILAPEIPNVIFEKEETNTQVIYRKKITESIDFVTIVYKNDSPVTAHSYLMDQNNNILLEATNYFILDESNNGYDIAYSSDDTDYNFIYSDSIKKENNSMEYYYRINNGNFTIDYYQKGSFLYSLGFIRERDKMKDRIQYYNENKIISYEYEHFSDGTNIVYRLDENRRFQYARNYGNFTLDSQENEYYFYDNNSLVSHKYIADENTRYNYIYDFENLLVYEVSYTSDWRFKDINSEYMRLKAFNPFYYEKYAELFAIYDIGVYFKSFQFMR